MPCVIAREFVKRGLTLYDDRRMPYELAAVPAGTPGRSANRGS